MHPRLFAENWSVVGGNLRGNVCGVLCCRKRQHTTAKAPTDHARTENTFTIVRYLDQCIHLVTTDFKIVRQADVASIKQ